MKKKGWITQSCIAVAAVLIISGLSVPLYAGYIETPDAYWPLNSNASPIDEMITGDPYNGICNDLNSDKCPGAISGMVSNALNFNENLDEVYVPAVPTGTAPFDWLEDESFSIEFWMRRGSDNLAGNEVIISRDDGLDNSGGMHLWVGINSAGKATFVLRDIATSNDPNYSQIISDTTVADGEWHHIVAIRDAETGQILLYVDGMSEPTTGPVATAELGALLDPNRPLTIGYLNDHGGDRLHFGENAASGGDVDEVALYSTVLAADIVKQHYLNGQQNKGLGAAFDPIIVSTPLDAAAVGYTYSYDTDAAGNPMPTYTLSAGPDGMTMTNSQAGELAWVPFYTDSGLDHPFTVTATNSGGSVDQNKTVTVYDLCSGDMGAYWDFNSSSSRYADVVNDNDGDCTGGNCPIVINAPDSIVGAALQFNGANTWIDVPDDPVGQDIFDWGSEDSFSIEFWLRRANTISSNEVVVGRDDGDVDKLAGMQWWVGLNASGQVRFYLRDQFDKTKQIVGQQNIADNQWHHVVAIRDKANEELRLYVDGQPDPQTSVPTTSADFVVGFPAPLRPLNIGYIGDGGAGSNQFGGDLDEVALYNFALPQGISVQHYTYSQQIARGYCNTAPVITGQNVVNGTEDTPFTISLSDLLVTDQDNNFPADHTLTIFDGTNYTHLGSTITPASDFNGSLTIKTVVSDPFHDSNQFNLSVDVGAVNDPPVVGEIPGQQIMAEDAFQPILLDNYVTDVDTDTNLLKWSYSGNTSLLVSISSGRVATITTPSQGWTGTETITFRATDPFNSLVYGENSASFSVSATEAPVVSDIPDQTISAGGNFTVINLDSYVADADTDDAQLTWTYSGNTNLSVTIDGATRTATVSVPNATWTGAETITFRAADPSGNFDEDDAVFTVEGDSGGGGGGGGGCFISATGYDFGSSTGTPYAVHPAWMILILAAAVLTCRKPTQ